MEMKTEILALNIEPEIKQKLRELAKEDDRSMSSYVRHLLLSKVQHNDNQLR